MTKTLAAQIAAAGRATIRGQVPEIDLFDDEQTVQLFRAWSSLTQEPDNRREDPPDETVLERLALFISEGPKKTGVPFHIPRVGIAIRDLYITEAAWEDLRYGISGAELDFLEEIGSDVIEDTLQNGTYGASVVVLRPGATLCVVYHMQSKGRDVKVDSLRAQGRELRELLAETLEEVYLWQPIKLEEPQPDAGR